MPFSAGWACRSAGKPLLPVTTANARHNGAPPLESSGQCRPVSFSCLGPDYLA